MISLIYDTTGGDYTYEKVEYGRYPDNTLLIKDKEVPTKAESEGQKKLSGILASMGMNLGRSETPSAILWLYESDEEMFVVACLKEKYNTSTLVMPYIPNARMDRAKNKEDFFTLKTFANWLNALDFEIVQSYDTHSNVAELLIDNLQNIQSTEFITKIIDIFASKENLVLFYPDEGAMKRYSDLIKHPYAFGVKKRDWETGEIKSLDVVSDCDLKGKNILIVDDICSKGTTFLFSAKALKELGANEIYLAITHCEKSIHQGQLQASGLIEKVFTTDSLYDDFDNDFVKIVSIWSRKELMEVKKEGDKKDD